MEPAAPAATPRERDPSSWWFLIHTKIYRYRALLRKYWWLVVFTTAAGLATSSWFVAQQKVVYVSSGRLIVSGRINLPEGTVFSEEMNYFMTTQRELMQDEAVRQRAENRVRSTSPSTPIGPVALTVAPLPQTSIFILTATGPEPDYPQKFLDAVMQEFIATRREMRTEKGETVGSAIADEIARVELELKKNEEKLIGFQRENNIGFLEQEGNSAGAFLSRLNTQLAELKTESQLLELFELDQEIARKQRAETADTNATTREGDPRKLGLNGPELGYIQARQQLELLKTERDDYAKDLKPKHPIIVDLDRQIAQQQQLIETYRKQSAEDLQRRREAARLEIQNLEKTIKDWSTKALDLSQRLAEYNSIQSAIAQKRTQLESLNRSKGSIEINRNVDQDVVSVRQKASPAQPQKPGVVRTVAIGVAFGLLAGLVILLLIDLLDDRVASFSEFQVHFAERVLAQIPHTRRKGGEAVTLLSVDDERHSFAEAFRSLRSSIFFLPVDGPPPKTFVITSATPNEGKSTVTTNCAVTIALAGSRVLLIDGDLRRGEIHRQFKLRNEVGFTDVLTGTPLSAAVQATHLPTLWLLPRGTPVPNPGELYLSAATDRFLKEVHPQYDYIIIDTSPVMAADDSTSLAPKADAVIFVFRFTSSSARVSRKAVQFLRERQANVIGIVCNDVSEAMQEYYYHRYPDYYGPAKKGAATT